jgi:UDP:flavonoid glycosyltransferase YjiC (YdhE family)
VPRVLLSSFGSAGDLFPLIPVAQQIEAAGSDVLFACPRSLGLYLRSIGIRSAAIGTGGEARVVHDPAMFTTRLSGWASWHVTWSQYVGQGLEADVEQVERVLESFQPDLVVTTSFATAARIAALRGGVPHLPLSIYPQHLSLSGRTMHYFTRDFVDSIRSLYGDGLIEQYGVALVAWGVDPRGYLLHDSAVLAALAPAEAQIVGFPYWDAVQVAHEQLDRTHDWLQASSRPTILITLGSFIGLSDSTVVREAIDVSRNYGHRALVVGAPSRLHGHANDDNDVLATGYLPLSAVLPCVDAVVHHGGIGTTFAVLHARRPSMVVPQSYDQPFTARLIAAASAGIDSTGASIDSSMSAMLQDPTMDAHIAEVADQLVSPEKAAENVVNAIDRLISAASPSV